MTFPTIECARHVRDGGIDAMAALDHALAEAIVGLSPHDQLALKCAFGKVMGEITAEIINPAVSAFPELKPDESTWTAVARSRATRRSDAV
jgi:hypothetical protein